MSHCPVLPTNRHLSKTQFLKHVYRNNVNKNMPFQTNLQMYKIQNYQCKRNMENLGMLYVHFKV